MSESNHPERIVQRLDLAEGYGINGYAVISSLLVTFKKQDTEMDEHLYGDRDGMLTS
jgi:hypothetical protein